MALPLLTTKLFIPPRRPCDSVVARSRLTDRLAATNGQRLTLIAAPAGFGKSTLLSEWIPHSAHCVPWLSLDANDNDPTRFWTYFIAAMQRLRPDLGVSALALLEVPQAPPIETLLLYRRSDRRRTTIPSHDQHGIARSELAGRAVHHDVPAPRLRSGVEAARRDRRRRLAAVSASSART